MYNYFILKFKHPHFNEFSPMNHLLRDYCECVLAMVFKYSWTNHVSDVEYDMILMLFLICGLTYYVTYAHVHVVVKTYKIPH